jgi:hypothetical protein
MRECVVSGRNTAAAEREPRSAAVSTVFPQGFPHADIAAYSQIRKRPGPTACL